MRRFEDYSLRTTQIWIATPSQEAFPPNLVPTCEPATSTESVFSPK